MGIGGGIFLITVGAILTFGVTAKVSWLNLDVVGWVLMLSGATVVIMTLWFWRERRRRGVRSMVEETRLVHKQGPVTPDAPDVELRNPPVPPEPPNLEAPGRSSPS
jgi:membrane protein implicated in regulation of membrane protease activity